MKINATATTSSSHIDYGDKDSSVLLNNSGPAGQAWKRGLTPMFVSIDGLSRRVPTPLELLKSGFDPAQVAKIFGLTGDEAAAILGRFAFDGDTALEADEMSDVIEELGEDIEEAKAQLQKAYDTGEITDQEKTSLTQAIAYLEQVKSALESMNTVFTEHGAEVVNLDR